MIIESGAVREQAVEGYRGGKRRWHLEAAEVAVDVCMQVEAPFGGQLHHRCSYNGFSVGRGPEDRPARIDRLSTRRLPPEATGVVDPSVMYNDESAGSYAGIGQASLQNVVQRP